VADDVLDEIGNPETAGNASDRELLQGATRAVLGVDRA
jgi:hypothetical protein